MAGTIRIAILANAAQARKEMESVGGAAEGITKKFSSLRAPAAAVLGAVGVGAVKAAKDASDLNETINKSNTIFGASSGSINSWAQGAAKNLGLSRQQALDSAAGFGDMFTQIGFAGDQAAKMSTDVVGLSADLGSFNNLPTADVAEKIQGAFRGEYDSLQALIPNINAARVESEAMAATGKKTAAELTAQEKATAVLAIVQKDGARAQGDFAKTSDGAANSAKIAAASAQDLSANLGQALLPAYTAILQAAGSFVALMNEHQGATTVVVGVIAGLAAAMLALSAATTIYNGVMTVVKIATAAYTAVQWALNAAMLANPIGLVVLAIVALVAVFVIAYKKSETFRNIVNGALKAVLAVAQAVWNGIKAGALAVWGAITAYVRLQIAIVTTVIKAIVAVATAVWNAIKTAAVAAFTAVKTAFTNQVNLIKTGFSKIKEFGSEALARIRALFSPGALVNAGRQLMQGLADGIRARIDAVVDMVRRAVQRIKDMLPGSPIRTGPLKSWNNGGAGKRLMGFLAYGIDEGSSKVRTSMARALDPSVGLGLGNMSVGAAGGGLGGSGGVVINVQAGVGDPVAIGGEVARVFKAYKAAGGRL